MSDLELTHYELLNDLILMQWNDGSEGVLTLKSVRDNCPCANCAGETDVFGNIYKGPPQLIKEESYHITGIKPIGHYAIQVFWKDGHHDGIFSYQFLKKLCEEFDN